MQEAPFAAKVGFAYNLIFNVLAVAFLALTAYLLTYRETTQTAVEALVAAAVAFLFGNFDSIKTFRIGLTGLEAHRAAVPRVDALENARFPARPSPRATKGKRDLPPGWFAFGDDVGAYDIGADDQHAHNGERSGYLGSIRPSVGFGALMQSFRADDYRARRLKLSAFCRSRSVEGWAGLWMRVDAADGEVLSFYNMEDQPIVGTTAWNPYQVVLEVPEEAARIAFGCLLAGEGAVWCDDFEFEIVDNM